MRATALTNVSPAWRAPTWVAGKGQQQPSYRRIFDRLVCAVQQPFTHIHGGWLETARTGTLTVGARHARDRADQRVARMAGSHMGGWKGSEAEITA